MYNLYGSALFQKLQDTISTGENRRYGMWTAEVRVRATSCSGDWGRLLRSRESQIQDNSLLASEPLKVRCRCRVCCTQALAQSI